MMLPSDCFTSSDHSTAEELIEDSTKEPIRNTYRYRQQLPENSDQSPVSQRMLQSLEPHKHRSKKRKPLGRKHHRRTPEPKPNLSNEYSAIVCLGFTLIKFLFLFVVGFIIAYIFASFAYPDGAKILEQVGSIVMIPLVILVFCMMAIIVFIESCR
jgi:hypothetical protein